MATNPKRPVTFEEWLHFPDHELRPTELIDGEVCEMPGASFWHQELAGRLYFEFRLYLRDHGGGHVFADANVRLADDLGPRPDLIFVREYPGDPLYLDGPPDLAVEVVSDAWRDLRMKRDRYERFGVPEYWAVLPDAERIEVYRLVDGAYGKPMIVEPGEHLSPLAVPGLEIDVAALFRR